MTVLLIAAHRTVLNESRSTATKELLLRHKELASTREYCLTELQKPAPGLDDTWYPYLLAFGLGSHVDEWFRAFGGATADRSSSGCVTSYGSSDSNSGSSGGSSGGSFGGFGGAGATVAFGSALDAMSSGASAPTSSSSVGGSSGSGGSSGGGGGAGW